ncbi:MULTISPECIES: hypothetical protein [Rhodobacterales]|uniref:hypothetical protein n=1 Tax=Rhodobacterales TaxID=204455 RepID=UPI00089A9F81|nr:MULTISPECIES: hypothetical protein [Paracoccaceae]SEB78246.1 hypothetical protein SAMN05519105_1298 [Rhodobacter sp. 24-YEA-8]
MDIEEKERIARFRDTSPEAIALRLRAARSLVAEQQKDFAALLNINPKTYHYQEKTGAPSFQVLDYLYRNARVGPNFVIIGEMLPLPGDVQLALIAALQRAN